MTPLQIGFWGFIICALLVGAMILVAWWSGR